MNEAKLHEFMGKVVTDMGGAWMMATVLIGDELGLYKAMADRGPVTPMPWPSGAAAIPAWSANGSTRTPPPAMSRRQKAVIACRPSKRWRWRTKIRRSSSRRDRAWSPRVSWTSTRSSRFRGNGAFPWSEHHRAIRRT
jgi:hypothetical protein